MSKFPVQAPTKYELAINLKTAKAPASPCHPALLARASEVINETARRPPIGPKQTLS